MGKIISILILFVSCACYGFAPDYYSFGYCLWVHNLFLFTAAVIFLMDAKNEKMGFNLFFSISFFFTNMVYPIYIYPIDPDYSLFNFPFNENVITKCTALAQIAYSAYACGYLWKQSAKQYSKAIILPISISYKRYRKIELGVCVFVALFVLLGGLEYFEDRYVRSDMSSNMAVQYMMLFFAPIVILFSSIIFLSKDRKISKRIYVLLVAIAFLLMFSGTRTIPLMIFAALAIVYCQRNKVSFGIIFLIVVAGTLLMSYVGNARSEGLLDSIGEVDSTSQFGWIENFSDLFINNRNLYVLYDFANTHNYTYGLSMMSCFLSPIPFAQSLFINVTGIPYYLLGSADFVTFLQFGNNPPMGLGTNMVGDVFLAFGTIGIFVFFFALGRFVVFARSRMRSGSYMYLVIYLAIASDAIYLCRAVYFDFYKIVIWTLALAWLLTRPINRKCI